ncbi:hypothetical protein EH31_04495 [Erythrobacter longus]|uniref:Uncharacterized protein n=1 Tax=Erythrobacter longus TaxID=1044 RepID=A0A074N1Y2_ERYLO|nr:hypothetical protein [Erythrobacter longus]KEO91937.1 hypothetical protein EH31_04495 [Erythrobacter longus]
MTAIGAAGFNGSYFTSDFYGSTSSASAKIGLDGYWYHRDNSGCFEGGPVYTFENNDPRIIMSGEVTKADVEFAVSGSERYFFLMGENDKEYRYIYKNTGTTLEVIRIDVIDGLETISIEDQFPAYVRCEHPTTAGLIQSLFFKVFEPS